MILGIACVRDRGAGNIVALAVIIRQEVSYGGFDGDQLTTYSNFLASAREPRIVRVFALINAFGRNSGSKLSLK
jgi:hypothetical protein